MVEFVIYSLVLIDLGEEIKGAHRQARGARGAATTSGERGSRNLRPAGRERDPGGGEARLWNPLSFPLILINRELLQLFEGIYFEESHKGKFKHLHIPIFPLLI